MKYLKLNLILFFFIVCFSIETQAMIQPRMTVRDTIKNEQFDYEKECIREIQKKAQTSLYVGGIFLIPTVLLSSTFLISKSVFKSALLLSLVKGAAGASLLLTLGCLISFIVIRRRLKTKKWEGRKMPILEKLMCVTILGIGLISVLSMFFFSIPTLMGLGFLLKLLNAISGGVLTAMGFSILFSSKYNKNR